ncbi:MAG: hypothetical protein ACRDKV_02320 [Solirubrobacterales bacterium]
MSYPLENALFQWEEGHRRLEDLRDDPRAYRRAARVVDAIRDELRRRIGPTFKAAELAELYAGGTDWAAEVAAAADSSPAPDPGSLADAAFWLYLRGARDYAGGRQVILD